MLAQSFMSADELHITEPQRDALQKVLVLLETGKMTHYKPTSGYLRPNNSWYETGLVARFDGHFNLATWGDERDCGSVCCIGGTAEAISGVSFDGWMDRPNSSLHDLFAPHDVCPLEYIAITPSQAARALRSYLTTGNANWAEAAA